MVTLRIVEWKWSFKVKLAQNTVLKMFALSWLKSKNKISRIYLNIYWPTILRGFNARNWCFLCDFVSFKSELNWLDQELSGPLEPYKYFWGGLYLSARGLILSWQIRETSRYGGVAKFRFHFSRWIKGWREW